MMMMIMVVKEDVLFYSILKYVSYILSLLSFVVEQMEYTYVRGVIDI